MQPAPFTKQVVRRFVLGRQGLWPGRRWSGQAGVAAALTAIEAVQIDPLNVVARSHDLVLASRVLDYRPDYLSHLLFGERAFFDYGGAVFIYPIGELPYWRVIMNRKATEPRWREVATTHARAIDDVRAALTTRGPLASRDFAGTARLAEYSYRATKDTGIALYYLWLTGEIMTHHRQGAERVYDLRRRIVPDALDVIAPVDEAEDFFARKEIAFRGIVRQRGFASLLASAFERPVARAEADAWLAQLQAKGEIMPVQIDNQPDLWFALSADRPVLDVLREGNMPEAWRPVGSTTEDAVTFLAPLDIVSARGRAKQLLDFDYIWEVYKPAAARRWGYYTLPILFGDSLVARLDPRFDRGTRTLVVNGLWLEEGAMTGGQAFTDALSRGLAQFAQFLGACDIDLGSVRPEVVRRALENGVS
jgi:uncharacterized protein YcaQ